MKPTIFIDGEAGTTGLQIRQRLESRSDLELILIDPAKRKDQATRAEHLNGADVVVLCLPDDAAREAVSLIVNPEVKVIDASTAHRTAEGWIYGFPEMAPTQQDEISKAKRVTNAGCWAAGAIALYRPLIASGLMSADYPATISGVSGYSGGGKTMIAEFENEESSSHTMVPYRIYGLELKHKHLPEMQMYSGLNAPPLFSPAVGRFRQGMIVDVPIHFSQLAKKVSVADVHGALANAYAGQRFVKVVPLEESAKMKSLAPEGVNGTNDLHIHVFGAADGKQARLVALLDNLGKGASGQAVQNLNIMLGFPEATGLER
jgi:N-acetyl-gamma-glutamyl-phosphate reductase